MNDTGPEAVPPPASFSFEERMRDRLTRAGTALEDDALVAVPAEDRLHRVVDGEDEAGGALRPRLDADVEPHRTVEAGLLLDQQMRQLAGEGLRVDRRLEVALRLAPTLDRLHHARDQLLDAVLALGAAERAAEVLRDDDVGGELRPGGRELDVALLEHHLALLAADHGVALLPLHLVERIDPRGGEEALHPETGATLCDCCADHFALLFAPSCPFRHRRLLLCGGALLPLYIVASSPLIPHVW
jgi:hypothetical protein